jgi:accessory colonization factor AcfC
MFRLSLSLAALGFATLPGGMAEAAEPMHVYGAGGPLPAMQEAAAAFAVFAANSAEAKQRWMGDHVLDAWPIWTIWQAANPKLADQVAVEPQYAIYRDTAVALTRQGESRLEAKAFVQFLASPEGARIFAKWGWKTDPN